MNKLLFRRIQLLSNVAIIVIALLLGIIVTKQFLLPVPAEDNFSATQRQTTTFTPAQPSANSALSIVGKIVPLDNIDWAKNKKTLVMYISDTCRFCTESGPFYQRLLQEKAAEDLKFVVVLPRSVEQGRKYLKKLEVDIDDVYQASFNSIGVKSTPTLLLVDENGVVTDFWVGKLTPEREHHVLSKLEK